MALETSEAVTESAPRLDVPNHVAIIMDGNGRWARQRGHARLEGHRAGAQRIRQVLSVLERRGVRYVTLYAFSTENWGRPPHRACLSARARSARAHSSRRR